MVEPTESVTVERLIPAPADAIFAIISDPHRHREIDGSGTVRNANRVPQKLALGSTFGMSMFLALPYAMVSTVIEYEENRLLAWQTRGPTFVGSFFGGRIWRYELQPADGGTLVRETWDYSQESAVTKPLVRKGGDDARKNMTATLARIEEVLTSTS